MLLLAFLKCGRPRSWYSQTFCSLFARMQFQCLKGWRNSKASLRPLVQSSSFLCWRFLPVSLKASEWLSRASWRTLGHCMLLCNGEGRAAPSVAVAWQDTSGHSASGYRCILTHNFVAIPIAIPINPSVGIKGKVCYAWEKPNWGKGRKQEVVSIFLILQIVQWLSNGHLTLYEHKP